MPVATAHPSSADLPSVAPGSAARKNRLHRARLGLPILVAALHVTCGADKNPSSPTPPPGPGLVANSLAIMGDGSFTALKQTSQLTATATFSDGSTQNVTALSQTLWGSSDETVAKVRAGLVTAVGYGSTIAYAEYAGQSAGLDVRVLPAGTFILFGSVFEPVGQPIDGAHVELTGGGGIAPRSTETGNGYYVFNGVSGSVKVTVSHDDYVTQSKTVTMSEDRMVDFEVTPTTAPAKVGGTYQLTFTASGSCGAQLTPDQMKRTYTARVEQSGAGLRVTLSGAEFIYSRVRFPEPPRLSNEFGGRINRKAVTFSLREGSFGFFGTSYDVAEHLGTQYLGIAGEADGNVSGSTMSGQIGGSFDVFNVSPPQGSPVVTCKADDHRFSFEK